jgi:hypothetical protein
LIAFFVLVATICVTQAVAIQDMDGDGIWVVSMITWSLWDKLVWELLAYIIWREAG